MQDTTISRMMMRFSHGLKRFFVFSILASAANSLLGFLTPIIVGFTIDNVIAFGSRTNMTAAVGVSEYVGADWRAVWLLTEFGFARTLIICAALAGFCSLVAGLFEYSSRINMAKGAERLIRNLRDTLFEHTQNLSFEWHTQNKTGDTIQRCTSDVDVTRRFVQHQLVSLLNTLMLVIVALILMFTIDVRMALVVSMFIPVTIAYSLYFYRKISKKFLACDEAESELMVRVQENLTGVRVVRAFGRERYETERFDEKNHDFTNKWISLGSSFGMYWGVGDIVSYSQVLAVVVIGSYFAAIDAISFGTLLVFISYTLTLMWPVRSLGRLLSEMSRTGVALKRIKYILDSPTEVFDSNAEKPPINRDIEFKNVTFAYGEQPVLKDISFTIKSGTTFGILGTTGSGKSTITYLLNRLYDLPENSGEITIGGVNINRFDKAYLRKNIGLVLQEPFLFSKTLFENIDIASRRGDIKAVREKADIAALDENVMTFVKQYDTIVGERGMTLSGGQKQRVAIARTLMMEAPIMIFDDSMSSLDMETDAKIRNALRSETADATVILISHRISTLMTADMIMVLEDGEIIEIGTHAELVEKNGHYRRVYDLQSGITEDSHE